MNFKTFWDMKSDITATLTLNMSYVSKNKLMSFKEGLQNAEHKHVSLTEM